MKTIKLFAIAALTAAFVACGGAEVSFAPDAMADGMGGSSGIAGSSNTNAGVGSTACSCTTGPQGVPGAQGPTGPAGKDGAAGPQGPAGKDGQSVVCVNDLNNCPPGVAGAQGPTGPMGPAGTNGAKGADGSSCSVSGSGSSATVSCTNGTSATITAPAGAPGAQGATGATGATGPAGPQGATGPAGKDGANGLALTKSMLYTRSVPGANAASCDDENDIVITGSCSSTNGATLFVAIGAVAPVDPTLKSSWTCITGTSTIITATVVCLKVQ